MVKRAAASTSVASTPVDLVLRLRDPEVGGAAGLGRRRRVQRVQQVEMRDGRVLGRKYR